MTNILEMRRRTKELHCKPKIPFMNEAQATKLTPVSNLELS